MRRFIITMVMLLPLVVSAQSLINSASPIIKQNNDAYEFIKIDEFGHVLIRYSKYDESGALIQEGYYSNGKPVGTWNMYDLNGKIISTMKYDAQGRRAQLSTENDDREMIVWYDENRPVKVTTRIKLQE
jgi:antitoxin component YwqK of YwqJK toxin-antitoxin module